VSGAYIRFGHDGSIVTVDDAVSRREEGLGVRTAERTGTARVGTAMALLSAGAFGSSGPMAKALIESGWTAGAVVLVRLGGAAALLCVVAAVSLRGRWRPGLPALRTLLLYGVVAMAGVQLAFFNAVRTLDVGVALLLEYLAPVLLLVWTAARARSMPRLPTLLGAGLTLVGLAFVLELTGTGSLDPAGVAWALLAAVCLAAFFALSERQDADLPPLVMAAGGTAVGATVIAVAGALGVVPMGFSATAAVLGGTPVSWIVPAAWLALVATVVAYLSGIGGILRLGSRSASFVALSEVLFAVVVAWALLAELPGPAQLIGGVCIVAGIVLIRRQERIGAVPRERLVDDGHDVQPAPSPSG
jgi:drug/metabolite transporter (DMT)-like permease